jgi:hypothetical protein
MTLDTILLARALRHGPTAAYLRRCLDVRREPTDRADRFALRFWRRLLPVLPNGPHDLDATLDAAAVVRCREACVAALSIPAYLDASAGSTAGLVAQFNAGLGTRWRLPVAAASRKPLRDVLADMALRGERAA